LPTGIEINDIDIDRVASELGIDLGGADRRAVLKCTESKDIQAGPGCGKTTLLVAKLAILASKWKWRDRGICVLSHTNVAREEVQKRLSSVSRGSSLLGYPHFVHTFQTFVDTFLALPYLRSKGASVCAIDNDRFAEIMKKAIESNHFGFLRSGLMNRFKNDMSLVHKFVCSLRYSGPDLEMDCADMKFWPKDKTTKSYESVERLKNVATDIGVYRFDDMYAFAEAYFSEAPDILESLRTRFSWVFVDELQDTDPAQIKLLSSAFGQNCIVQRFGDGNQAILALNQSSGQQNLFQDNSLDVQGSMRFGPTIAQYVSRLAIRGTTVSGDPSVHERRNTIFSFECSKTHSVLPAYGDLLLDEYQAFSTDFVAKAIGAVHRLSNSDKLANIPNCVSDYWPQYAPEVLTSSPRPNSMLQAMQKARHAISKAEQLSSAYNILIDAIVDFLSLVIIESDQSLPITRKRVKQLLKSSAQNDVNELKLLLLRSCLSSRTSKQDEWSAFTNAFEQSLLSVVSFKSNTASKQFLKWTELDNTSLELGAKSTLRNVYSHERDGRRVNIELGSIHSVKGETHSAVLVLETHQWSHDLDKVLPYLAGKKKVARDTGVQEREHLKRIFVAMSRPRELVCLAVRNDHVAQYENELRECGWHIQHV